MNATQRRVAPVAFSSSLSAPVAISSSWHFLCFTLPLLNFFSPSLCLCCALILLQFFSCVAQRLKIRQRLSWPALCHRWLTGAILGQKWVETLLLQAEELRRKREVVWFSVCVCTYFVFSCRQRWVQLHFKSESYDIEGDLLPFSFRALVLHCTPLLVQSHFSYPPFQAQALRCTPLLFSLPLRFHPQPTWSCFILFFQAQVMDRFPLYRARRSFPLDCCFQFHSCCFTRAAGRT